jgi:hypothetical protein
VNGQNTITAVKNFPALITGGDLIVGPGAQFQINGLAVVHGQIQVSAAAGDLDVLGGLFTQDSLFEAITDSSGNSHTGSTYGGPTWRPSGGRTAGALEFDGADDTVEDPDAGGYLNGLSAITVSLWIKSDLTYVDRGIIFARNPTGADEELGIRYDRNGAFGGGVRVIKASVKTTWGYTQIESTSNVQTTNWQHLALVWENNTGRLKLYINGALNPLAYDMGPTFGTVTGVQKLMLGRGTKSQYWDGMMDDLRIYNRVLDANDIYPPVDGLPGLLTHWRLDDTGCDVDITTAPCKTAILTWPSPGVAQRWEQVGGAFFRSITRR